jgi:ketosteroid isomerase-like protein
MMTLDELITKFHVAASAFAQGDPEPVKRLFSKADDVTLANPFGPPVRGWTAVARALDHASSRFSQGHVGEIRNIASYVTSELATYLDTEKWKARVGGGKLTEFNLRVTTTYRPEAEGWLIVHRHADPISRADERGPLRAGASDEPPESQ